jgi:hypothetical protein
VKGRHQDAEREAEVVRQHRRRGHVVVVARVWTVCLVDGSEERIVGAVVNYLAVDAANERSRI